MKLRRLLLPNLACIVWLAVFLLCTCTPFASHAISADGDFALHVTHGTLILEGGGPLHGDPTSVLSRKSGFIGHEWLSQATLGLAHAQGGIGGAALLMAALMATVFAVLFVVLRREKTPMWVAVGLLLLAMLVARVHMIARPHLVTWLLALVWTWRLERFRRGELSLRRWLGVSLLIIVPWANLHGGFAFAFFILGLFGLGELFTALSSRDAERGAASLRFGQLFTAGLLLLLASGLNPYGFGLHAHVIDFLQRSEAFSAVREFAPLDLGSSLALPAIAFALLAIGLLIKDRRAPLTWVVLVLGLMFISLRSARHAPMFALLVAPLLGASAARVLGASQTGFAEGLLASSERLAGMDGKSGGWLTALVVAFVVGLAGTPMARFDPERLPVDAVRFIKENPELFSGRASSPLPLTVEGTTSVGWTEYAWSGYVIHELHPAHPAVFASSFSDQWSDESYARFVAIHEADSTAEWKVAATPPRLRFWMSGLICEFGWALVEDGAALCVALEGDEAWREVYRDAWARLFVRGR